MEKFSYDVIPGLIILNSGTVTRTTGPTDEELEQLEEKAKGKQTTTARKPELIRLNAGVITRVT